MAIKDRIKEMRQARNLTQEQLAKRIGVAKSTLAGYETGIREPGIEIIGKIMHELDIDANYLWQDEGNFQMQASYLEMEHIKKYHDLDDFGKKHIDYELDREVTRVKELNSMKERMEELESTQATVIDIQPHPEGNTRLIEYHRSASAGTGVFILGNETADQLPIPDTPENRKADYAIMVSGNSMEPDEINALLEGRKDRAENGTIPHEAIDWD